MKKLALLILIFVIALNYSCKKDNEEQHPEPIKAGFTDAKYYSQTLSSPIEIIPVMDQSMLTLTFDSLIVFDSPQGDISLHIRYTRVNNDSITSIENSGDQLTTGFYLFGNEDLYFNLSKQTYYGGQGTTVDMSWVTPYNYGNIINDDGSEDNIWNNNRCKLWEMPVPYTFELAGFKGGMWKDIVGIHYVGFRYKGMLGWIAISKAQDQYSKIISYAIRR